MTQEKEPKVSGEGFEPGMVQEKSPVVEEAVEEVENTGEDTGEVKEEGEGEKETEWFDKVMGGEKEAEDAKETPEREEDPRKKLFQDYVRQLRLTRRVFKQGKIFDASPTASDFAGFVREQKRDKTLVNTVESIGAQHKFLTGVDRFRDVPNESQHLVIFRGDMQDAFQVFEGQTATRPENVEKGLRELLRLVENGGELRIGPIRTDIHEGPQKAMLGLLESALVKLGGEEGTSLEVKKREHDPQIPGGDGLEKGQFVLSVIKKGGKAESGVETGSQPEEIAQESDMVENGDEGLKEAA